MVKRLMTHQERPAEPTRLERMLSGSPYQQYLYGYPHKTAYRTLTPALPLHEVWANERRDALFLYLHIPFCEMRCGFCNLFTAANPVEDVVAAYVGALEREGHAVREAVGPVKFARAAVGGGTPTFLEAGQLERVFSLMQRLGAPLGTIPMSVELSPETTTPEKLRVIRAAGADRVSIGVQSFLPAEVAAVKRPQALEVVRTALNAIRQIGFRTLNLDLIYGIEGQTPDSFLHSIRAAFEWQPEELYLYPLYVRPLTYLGKAAHQWDDARLALYRVGREFLLGNGYEQVSMRMFRRRADLGAPAVSAPVYHCQEDGMIGLGCGARSYTRRLHYSQEWAVASRAVRGIIDDYSARSADDFAHARHGLVLDDHEERRRYAILSVLAEGIDSAGWALRFGTDLAADLPELNELVPLGLARREGTKLVLTPAGIERSDVIGPWLHSAQVDALMAAWEKR